MNIMHVVRSVHHKLLGHTAHVDALQERGIRRVMRGEHKENQGHTLMSGRHFREVFQSNTISAGKSNVMQRVSLPHSVLPPSTIRDYNFVWPSSNTRNYHTACCRSWLSICITYCSTVWSLSAGRALSQFLPALQSLHPQRSHPWPVPQAQP